MRACWTGGDRWDSTVRPPAGTAVMNICALGRQWERERLHAPVRGGSTTADGADDTPHDAQYAEVGVLSHDDRGVFRVCRDELDALLERPVVLDGRLVIQQRHDDVAGTGAVLLLHDDVVALQDSGVDHAVAADLKREELLGVAEHLAQ